VIRWHEGTSRCGKSQALVNVSCCLFSLGFCPRQIGHGYECFRKELV